MPPVTTASNDPRFGEARVPDAKPPLFADNLQFWFEVKRVFGASSYGGSEFGEVLATANKITSGDPDSWYAEWNALAERIFEESAGKLARGHRISARDGFLRASHYFRTSEFFLHANPDDRRMAHAYAKTVESYRVCAALFDPPIEPVEIPYENTTLPGYLHRVDDTGRKRPLLIIHSGFDGSAEEVHYDGARAAVERGYHVLAFDGPGQFGPIHRAGLTFRPDWEQVVTPVVDYALTLPEVDPERIALMGISLGGYLAPRAAAYEKRLAALIANDGVYDYGAAQLRTIPPAQLEQAIAAIKAPESPEMDKLLSAIMRSNPTADWALTHGAYVMGASSPRGYLKASLAYHLRDGVAEAISCPTLVCEAEGDLFFKGQAQELFEHLTCPKALIRFTDREGAGAHCQVGAARLAFGRMYDWLDEVLGRSRKITT